MTVIIPAPETSPMLCGSVWRALSVQPIRNGPTVLALRVLYRALGRARVVAA